VLGGCGKRILLTRDIAWKTRHVISVLFVTQKAREREREREQAMKYYAGAIDKY